MYLVNTTFVVDHPRHDQWLDIIKRHYIPLLRQRGYRNPLLSRVITNENTDHFTYSLLVDVEDISAYQLFTGEIFEEYSTIAGPMFGSEVLHFTTLMKKQPLDE